MKRGLVFSGGGSRGAYQIGVWMALEKLNIKCDIVTGTSIGAINGAMYVLGNLKQALKMWNNLDFKTVFEEEFNYNSSKDDIKAILKYLKSIKKGGISPNNLYDNLLANIDLDKFFNSNIDYGLITVSYPYFKQVLLTKNKIKKDRLIDYIMASATVFPLFKIKEIDKNKYIDGGFKNSVPINLAIDLGAEELIVVDISVFGRRTKIDKKMDIVWIKPKNNIGNPLTFNKKTAKRNIKYGYNDTMKAFNILYGKKFTFKDNKNIDILEYLGASFKINNTIIYTNNTFNKIILNKLNEICINEKAKIKDFFDVRERIKYIYMLIINNDKKVYNIKKIFVKEYNGAYYLVSLNKNEIVNNNCNLCPRKCNIDRKIKIGFCGVNNKIKIARASIHMWEEPIISGKTGSGTIFFSGCNLKCVYCQNYEISHNGYGKEIDINRLVEIFFELKEQGANNINFVTPSHYVEIIRESILLAKKRGFDLPFVYNSSGYDSVSSLKKLDGLIDIYLPDFKYFNNAISFKYSFCNNYVEIAKCALEEMYRQVGKNVFNGNGMLNKGIIVRHLVLPGCIDDSKKIIEYLYKNYKDNIYISIMNQYTPSGNLANYKEIDRTITKEEYDEVIEYASNLGINNAFVQEEGTCLESFIPKFDLSGI